MILSKANKLTADNTPWKTVEPHPHLLKIPFMHRKLLSNRFNDILGLHSIDHISIEIINPDLEWVSLSSTPSMLHNLITSGLWIFDGNLSPAFYKKLSSYRWSEAYYSPKKAELIEIKEKPYKLHYGFCLCRQMNDFSVIYSFATKRILQNYDAFFRPKFDDLLKIGDYCQKQFRNVYQENCEKYTVPILYQFIPYQSGTPKQVMLKNYDNVLTLVPKHNQTKNGIR